MSGNTPYVEQHWDWIEQDKKVIHKKIELDVGEPKVLGYHSKEIVKGVVGEISKIREELDEVVDAESTGNKVMLFVELSDMILAIDRYLEKHHPNITVQDLLVMAAATKRAFDSGTRT